MTLQATPRSLPRGPHALGRRVVLASQHERLVEGVVQAVADKGYADTTVADIVARAGVSRTTFYEHFADREECFLAAYEAGVDTLIAAIVEAVGVEGEWLDRLRAGTRAYLGLLAAEPAFARTFFLEVYAAGPRALDRRAEVMERFARLLGDLHSAARADDSSLPAVPEPVYSAAVGGINEIVTARVRGGATDELTDLEDPLMYIQLALFADHERAAGALRGGLR